MRRAAKKTLRVINDVVYTTHLEHALPRGATGLSAVCDCGIS